jgi:glycosyltransferase involved in cell wall biosynthesis
MSASVLAPRGLAAGTASPLSGAGLRICMLLHKSVVHDSRVRREARTLAAAGHCVTVIELGPVATPSLDGFTRVSALPAAWVRRRMPSHLYRIAFAINFVRHVRAFAPDVVHAHDAAMLAPGLLGARLTGARLLYDSHELATSVPYRERGWARFVAAVERLAVPRADAVVTVSDGIAELLHERYSLRRRPAVVRNVCALTRPSAQARRRRRTQEERRTSPRGPDRRRSGLRVELGVDDTVPVVLHQGAAAPGRGCETLIRALGMIDNARLVFLGQSTAGFGAELERLAAELGLADRVHFFSSVALSDLLVWTAEADVGVSLLQDTCENHRHALPNKVFEYIAARLPVVVSSLPELERVTDEHGIGWAVDPADPVSVAKGLNEALQSADANLHWRLEHAGETLAWEREQSRLLAVYEELPTFPRR